MCFKSALRIRVRPDAAFAEECMGLPCITVQSDLLCKSIRTSDQFRFNKDRYGRRKRTCALCEASLEGLQLIPATLLRANRADICFGCQLPARDVQNRKATMSVEMDSTKSAGLSRRGFLKGLGIGSVA